MKKLLYAHNIKYPIKEHLYAKVATGWNKNNINLCGEQKITQQRPYI